MKLILQKLTFPIKWPRYFQIKSCWKTLESCLSRFGWIWTCVRSYIYTCVFVFLRGEKSVLWLFGESAWSHQLPGYSWLCRNSQLPRPDAGGRALFQEAFLWGGSARGVHAAQPDRSRKAHKMWWNPGMETGSCEVLTLLSVVPSVVNGNDDNYMLFEIPDSIMTNAVMCWKSNFTRIV